MGIEENAKQSILEWIQSAKLHLDFTSALEKLGIHNIVHLNVVESNVFACTTKKAERFLLHLQADCKKAWAWVDHNGERRYFLVEKGIIQRA